MNVKHPLSLSWNTGKDDHCVCPFAFPALWPQSDILKHSNARTVSFNDVTLLHCEFFIFQFSPSDAEPALTTSMIAGPKGLALLKQVIRFHFALVFITWK